MSSYIDISGNSILCLETYTSKEKYQQFLNLLNEIGTPFQIESTIDPDKEKCLSFFKPK